MATALRAGRQHGTQLVLVFCESPSLVPMRFFTLSPPDADWKARTCDVNVVFIPTAEEMYPRALAPPLLLRG